ncbi:MAG: N-acetylmuramoyl-L-alanine amidase [Parachlamydiaceae bacterium]|nr:N-acetylmuramoyl-L-alanine amidase [Parachlamydiaceae bacterium]
MNTKILLYSFCLYLSCNNLYANTYSDFDQYQNKYTKDELTKKIETYLKKDDEITNYFSFSDNEFQVFATPNDKITSNPEFVLKLSSISQQKYETRSHKKLDQMKIAIDPGHFGGCFSSLEQRRIFVTQKNCSHISEEILFEEATLNLLTAKILKSLLEKEGVSVLLTKENLGCGVYEKNFWVWLKEQPPSNKSNSEYFRNGYNPNDLKARAKKINDFQPDITIIIHYNAHNDTNSRTGEAILTNANYNMVFVGGSFCKGELKDPEDRHEFVSLLLTTNLEDSMNLSREILSRFTNTLNVPLVNEDIPYLKRMSIKIEEGLYARNLALTRLVHSPLCYGESLCQDNIEECQLLNAKDLIVDGIIGPKRVELVAKAYFEGIRAYILSKK